MFFKLWFVIKQGQNFHRYESKREREGERERGVKRERKKDNERQRVREREEGVRIDQRYFVSIALKSESKKT